jgi:endonuclease/exonuclease/phosphatase family metal-dependent hydrolase
VRLRLVTWNLKGSGGVDVGAVAGHLREAEADVVVLQEVQRRQARDLARAVGAASHRWVFKHLPIGTWPEGMAIVGVTRPVAVRSHALTYRWRPWSWRRRVALVGALDGGGTVIDLHLSPHEAGDLRHGEIDQVLATVAERTGPVVVAGDLNEGPDGPIHPRLAAAGLRDAWSAAGGDGDGPTNWHDWRPGLAGPPTQRIDFVYVSGDVTVVDVALPRPDDPGFGPFRHLSDHLPVTATLDLSSR